MKRIEGTDFWMEDAAFAAQPDITWNHIDGPMMYWAGQIHWLTFKERLRLWLKLTTIEEVARVRFGRPLTETGHE